METLQAVRELYEEYFANDNVCSVPNLQNVHTPYTLCEQMIDKLQSIITDLQNKTFFVFNLEFAIVLLEHEVGKDKVCFLTDCQEKSKFAKKILEIEVIEEDFTVDNTKRLSFGFADKNKETRKFDVIIGNPPYQVPKDNNGNNRGTFGNILWPKFVELAFKLCVDNGFVSLIHPAGWRRPNNRCKDITELIFNKKILYTEFHSIADGQKTFSANTNYDWYIIKNTITDGFVQIKDYDGKIENIEITNIPFIPNSNIIETLKLFSNTKEHCIDFLFSYSVYETRKKWMNEEKTEEFCYPCVYSLPEKGTQLYYSNTKDNGHFGIPKVIFTNGAASQILLDLKGEYGLTQFAFAIIDDVENLSKIKIVMESKKFIDFCKNFNYTGDRYDSRCIACLKKDFWKDFV